MKILLIGLSGSGKSTVATKLSEKLNLEIIEADDEVKRENFGLWPDDEKFITSVFEATNERVINFDNFIYVISWMDNATIKKFFEKGFKIIEVHADFSELIRRKKGIGKLTSVSGKPFETTYIGYFNSVLSQEMLDSYALSLDTTNLSEDEVFKEISGKIASWD